MAHLLIRFQEVALKFQAFRLFKVTIFLKVSFLPIHLPAITFFVVMVCHGGLPLCKHEHKSWTKFNDALSHLYDDIFFTLSLECYDILVIKGSCVDEKNIYKLI